MAKGKGAIQGWITKNGIHIPIYGQYTVRGGVEPKAKGAKFKSAKVTAKTVSKALKKEYDEDSKETWYEGRINGKDVRITQETAGSNKFWNVDIGKPGDRHKLLTDNNEPMSFKSLEDAHDEIAYELNSDNKSTNVSKEKKPKRGMTAAELDAANKELDAKDAEADMKKYEAEHPMKKGKEKKYASKAKAEAEAYQKSGQLSNDLQTSNKALDEKWASHTAANGAPRVSDEDAGHNKEVEWNGGRYQTQQVRDWDSNKKQDYVAGHLYVPIDPKNGEKQFFVANEDGSVHSSGTDYLTKKNALPNPWREKASEQESSTPTIHETRLQRQAVNEKAGLKSDRNQNFKTAYQNEESSSFSPESSAQTINDMQRRRANGGGKNDDWKTAQSVLESAPAGTTMIQTGNRGVKFQYTKGDDGIWHSSAGEEYNSDSKRLSMSWVGDSGPRVEFTTSDKALSNTDIKASHDAATSGRLNQALGLDRNNRPIGNRSTRKVDTSTPEQTSERRKYKVDGNAIKGFKSAKEMTGRSDLTLHEIGNDNISTHYSFRDKDGNEIGQFHESHTNKKANYMTLNTSVTGDRSKPISKQDSLSAGTNERSRIRGELHAKDKAMKAAMPTTVSGLRSAYADATGSMKSKIAAELRRKGYSLVGGKWVKGRKE